MLGAALAAHGRQPGALDGAGVLLMSAVHGSSLEIPPRRVSVCSVAAMNAWHQPDDAARLVSDPESARQT